MKYTLRLRGLASELPLSNGMKAELSASNEPLGSTLTGEMGLNDVILTSKLAGTPTQTGEFKGEAVLFVSYP
jgi:hypothetical protein